jgi:hypothetical protein
MNPVFGLSLMYAQTYENSLAEYKSVAKERGLDPSPEAGERYAFTQASLRTPFELVGNVAVGQALKKVFKSIPRQALNSGPETFGKWIAQQGKNIAKSTASNTLVATPIQTLTDSTIAEKTGVRNATSWSEKGRNTLDAMSIALGQAGLLGVPAIGVGGSKGAERRVFRKKTIYCPATRRVTNRSDLRSEDESLL